MSELWIPGVGAPEEFVRRLRNRIEAFAEEHGHAAVEIELRDERLGLSESDRASLVASPIDCTGAAVSQVAAVTQRIEELIDELKSDYCIALVTHNMQQAARSSDYTGFLYLGELVEFDETERIFTHPKEKRTEDYITGRFG